MGWAEIFNEPSEYTNGQPNGRINPSILLVDDEPQILNTLQKYLSREDYTIYTAKDGEEALAQYKKYAPQIILTDIRMPGKSGLELLEEIRLTDSETEIIVVTGHGDLDSAIAALKLNASDFILKPIDFEIILMTLDRALQRIALRDKVKRYTKELETLLFKVNTSKKYLEAVFRNSPNALITYDLDGSISSWNAEAEAVTGYTVEEVLGKTLEQVLHLDNFLHDMNKDDTVKNSVAQILTKDRQLRFVSRNSARITNEQGEVVGGIESFIDLTEQIKSERLLEKRYLQVQTINDISKIVAGENDLATISDYVLQALHKTFFESSLLSLFFYEKSARSLVLQSIAGHSLDKLKIKKGKKFSANKGILGKVYRSGKALLLDNVPTSSDLYRGTLTDARSAYAFPIRSKNNMYGILHIENTEHMKLDESDRFMLEAIAEFLGISTERIRLLNKITHQNHLLEEQAKDLRAALRKVESQKEIIEKQNTRLIQDLRKAGDFQKSLLPDSLPQFDNIHFATSYIPSSQLGGDLYDIFNIDEDLVGIILADASGHGVAAAMLSAMFKMTLQKYAAEIVDPSQVMTRLNSDFCQVLQMGEFFTAFYAILNRRTGRFIYSNAAHPRPLLFNYEDGSMLELDTEGFLLGVMEEGIGYEQKELQLNGKIRLMIYTDGVNEATNAKEKQYGDDRVRMRLMEHAGAKPEDFLESIQKDLIKYTGSDTFEDDISILVMDYEKQ